MLFSDLPNQGRPNLFRDICENFIRTLREKPAEVNTYVPFKIHIIPENEK